MSGTGPAASSPPAALRAVLLAASTLTVMAGATMSPVLPRIGRAFAGHPRAAVLVPLVLTMPALCIGLAAPLAGGLLDRFGRRGPLVAGIALYAIAGTAGLYVRSLEVLLASRALLGLAVACVMTAATTLIGDHLRGEARSRFLGLQVSVMASAGVVFLLLGGTLSDWSWRAPFAVYLLSLPLLPLAVRIVPSAPPPSRLLRAEPSPQPVPRARVAALYALGFFAMAAFYLVPVRVPFVLARLGASGALTGVGLAALTLLGALASLRYRALQARFGYAGVARLTLALFGVGYALLLFSRDLAPTLLGMAVVGPATGLIMPNCNVWLLDGTPEAVRGRLVGGLTTAFFLGQFLSPLMTAPLVAAVGVAATFGHVGGGLLAVVLVWKAVAVVRAR